MTRILSLVSFFCALATSLAAQHSVLWEITGNGLSEKSYLMGTLKFTGAKEYVLPSEITDIMKKCAAFTIEDQVDHHAQHELNSATHFPKGQTLSSVMKGDDYDRLLTLFQSEFHIDREAFEKRFAHLKPLPLSIVMTRLSLGEKVKFYDIELLSLAKELNLTTYSLEPIEREAAALNQFSMEEQVATLNHAVANFDEQKKEFQMLVKAFPKGNAEDVYRFTQHAAEDSPQFLEVFYYKRNEEWLPKIDRMVHEKSTFIAVGLSHLEGDRGLVAQLKSKGYTLNPITFK
jgi:uncharacterized protein YbaP (TraB family)